MNDEDEQEQAFLLLLLFLMLFISGGFEFDLISKKKKDLSQAGSPNSPERQIRKKKYWNKDRGNSEWDFSETSPLKSTNKRDCRIYLYIIFLFFLR